MSGGAHTVLVVDDDPVIVRLLEVNFGLEGFEVVGAGDGELALDLAAAVRPDIVVADVMLPGLDGLELVRRLKAGEATARVPVVLLSARALPVDVAAGVEAGADDYVTKPFEPAELVERVRRLLAATGAC